jgi:hypothetical protein
LSLLSLEDAHVGKSRSRPGAPFLAPFARSGDVTPNINNQRSEKR